MSPSCEMRTLDGPNSPAFQNLNFAQDTDLLEIPIRPWAADRLNKAFFHQALGQAVKVEIAAKVAEALNDTVERRSRLHMGEPAQHARRADVPRRKYVEAPEPTQQHERGAPRADPRQVLQELERVVRGHAFNTFLVQFTRLDYSGEMMQRFSFPRAQATPTQRRHTRICDGLGRRKRMEAAPIVLQRFTEAFDQIAYDGHTRFQAQLLKRHDVGKCLEQTNKPWRPHAAQRICRRSKRRFSRRQPAERLRIYVQSEHLAHGLPEVLARHLSRVACSNGEPNVRMGNRAVVLNLDECKIFPCSECSQIAAPLPDIHPIGWPTLQNAYSRLEMKRRRSTQSAMRFR